MGYAGFEISNNKNNKNNKNDDAADDDADAPQHPSRSAPLGLELGGREDSRAAAQRLHQGVPGVLHHGPRGVQHLEHAAQDVCREENDHGLPYVVVCSCRVWVGCFVCYGWWRERNGAGILWYVVDSVSVCAGL